MNLKAVLERLTPEDGAQVQKQLVDQILSVRTRLAAVRRKILVLSGKGGVGKSAVTSQLGLAFARLGRRVGILDADLNGPCIPRMLGIPPAPMVLEPGGARPSQGPLGIKVASMALLADPERPLRWKGPMDLTPVWLGMLEAGVLRELLADVQWGALDLMLLDLPPGAAADKPPALSSLIPDLEGALVVTTPSRVSAEVVKRSILYARSLGIEVLGLVANLSGPSQESVSDLSRATGTPILARIPHDADLAGSLDEGRPLPEDHPISGLFLDLARRLQPPEAPL